MNEATADIQEELEELKEAMMQEVKNEMQELKEAMMQEVKNEI